MPDTRNGFMICTKGHLSRVVFAKNVAISGNASMQGGFCLLFDLEQIVEFY
jgi:hypothetical protein